MTSPGVCRSLRPTRRPPAAASFAGQARFAGLPGLVILAGLAALTGLAVPACGASGKNGTPRLSAGPAVSAPPSAEENPPRQFYTWEKDSRGAWIIRSIAAEADTAPRSADGTRTAKTSRWTLLLYYRFPAAETGTRGALTWKAPPAADGAVTETVFDFFPKALEHRPLVFNGERWGSLPEEITIEAGESFEPLAVQVEFRPDDTPQPAPRTPLRADLGTMLYYPRSAWRQDDYELFTFNLYPRLLYLISGNFAVQSRFLKRLAFFTEKPGFTGTLAADEDIAHLRDWFAHDYRAGDMARFFDLARRQRFPLNDSELLLKDILLARGIIRETEEGIAEGEGALIALSVESRQRLPVYYVHETVHGLEFTMPELGRLFGNFFASLSPQEQDFIRSALIYREYNVLNDRRLLASETAAYLLQQRPEETDQYFREYIRPWYEASRREAAGTAGSDAVLEYLDKDPGIFGRRSAALQKEFQALTGLRAEIFYDLLPKDRSL